SKPNLETSTPNSKPNHYAPKKTQSFKRHDKDQTKDNKGSEIVNNGEMKCFFCKRIGHRRKDCFKFTASLEKKCKEGGNPFALVCFESNMIDVPSNSWWLDSGATVHIAITLQL